MLQKLSNNSLISEDDRIRYTNGSISLTLWFDEDKSIFSFEVIFDLLQKEFAFLYSKNSPTRFVKIEDGFQKPGRTEKQSICSKTSKFTIDRLENFKEISKNIPTEQRNFILKIMNLMLQA